MPCYPGVAPLAHSIRSAALMPVAAITLLAVEDSRYASEALRLICRRAGLRLRRAKDLLSARLHLRCYNPDLVLIDLGLPDGRGEDLIAELAQGMRQGGPVVLAMSGDPAREKAALAAGARAFITKPLPGVAAFLDLIEAQLAGYAGAHMVEEVVVASTAAAFPAAADLLALRDDLLLAEQILKDRPAALRLTWLADFLSGLAGQSGDGGLAAAADALRHEPQSFVPVAALLRERIAQAKAFAQHGGVAGHG